MESPTAAASSRRTTRPPLFHERVQEPVTIASLKESLGLQEHRTFLDNRKFSYTDEVTHYFEGTTQPAHNPEEFLAVMETVLVKTEPKSVVDHKGTARARRNETREAKNEFNAAIRAKFLELYAENQEVLLRTESSVHKFVGEELGLRRHVSLEEEAPFMTSLHHNAFEAAVAQYLATEDSALVTKYISEAEAVNPTDTTETAEEFYELYMAVIKKCPEEQRPPSLSVSMSMVPSARGALRAQFDKIYAENDQALGKMLGEDKIRALQSAKEMPFFPAMGSPATAAYEAPSSLLRTPPQMSASAVLVREPQDFSQFVAGYLPRGEEFDFARAGLAQYKDQIIAVVEGRFIPRELPLEMTLFSLFKDIFTLIPATEQATILIAIRECFLDEYSNLKHGREFLPAMASPAEVSEEAAAFTVDEIRTLDQLAYGRMSFHVRSDGRFGSAPAAGYDQHYGKRIYRRGGAGGSGGGGWSPAKAALLIFAAYLTYRFVAKPAYQWYRANKAAPVGK